MAVVKSNIKRIPNKDSTYKYKGKTYRNPADVQAAIKQNLMQSSSVQNILATQRGNASETSSGRRINPVKQDVVTKGENINLASGTQQAPQNQMTTGQDIQLDSRGQPMSGMGEQTPRQPEGMIEQLGAAFYPQSIVGHDPSPTGKAILGVGAVIAVASIAATIGAIATAASGGTGILTTGTTQASRIPINSVTSAKTTSWLTKILSSTKTISSTNIGTGVTTISEVTSISTPKAIALGAVSAGSILTLIGSYPFAGFIKEEAIQTLGFGTNTAMKNNDIEGAEMSIAQTKEVLNPDIWQQIFNGVPYVNVLTNLKDFYKAAATKLEIDERAVEKMKRDMELEASGMDEDTLKWQQIEQENIQKKEQERQDDEAYYQKIRDNLEEAKKESRAEDEAYWTKINEENMARKEAERKKDAAYWEAIRKKREEDAPSKLNFGIL